MIRKILTILSLMLSSLTLTSCETTQNLMTQGLTPSPTVQPSLVNLQGFPNEPVFWQGNTTTVWNKLQHIALPELQRAAAQATDPTISAWLKLAVIGKQSSTNTLLLSTQLISWRAANPAHPANNLFPNNETLTQLQNYRNPQHIVLLLPLQGKLASSGQAVRDGFISAYYASPFKNQQTISFLDTSQHANVSTLYQQAIAEGADTVIGPLTKEDVTQLLHQGSFSVPTIALNYTDSWNSLPTHFYEYGLSPLDEAKQLAEKTAQAGHKRAIIIAPQDSWGQRVTQTLTANWTALGGSVADTLFFNTKTDFNQTIPQLLHANKSNNRELTNQIPSEELRRQDFDVIFLLASPPSARQIVPLLKYYYADKIPIYSTSVIYSGSPSAQDSDLNGVTFSDMPWNLQKIVGNPGVKGGNASNKLYAVGRDSYLLSNQILRLSKLPNFPIYGATGALTLTPKQQIYRRLAWVQMRNGHP